MLIDLPPELERAVREELQGVDPRRLAQRVRRLSEKYRAHRAAGRRRFVSDLDDARAYVASILPQSHAQLTGALQALPLRLGTWRPRSLLDIGAGPGTTAWVAARLWPELGRIVHVEADPAFLELGRRLGAASVETVIQQAEWDERDVVEEGLPAGRFDLVVLSLVLSELGPFERRDVLAAAWRKCEGVLVVVEPGTPATFEVVRHARAQLLRAEGHALAPCPHEEPCPVPEGDWCHFAVRASRPDFQRRAKEASLPWEDAKFSFAAVARFQSTAVPWARVVGRPKVSKGRVQVPLCAPEGLIEESVTKARREAWRAAKDLDWGSAVESEETLRSG